MAIYTFYFNKSVKYINFLVSASNKILVMLKKLTGYL